MGELQDHIAELSAKLVAFSGLLDVPAKEEEIARYETRMMDPAFWNDPAAAQQVVASLKAVKAVIDPYRALRQAVADGAELLALAEAEKDEQSLEAVRAEVQALDERYATLELRLALSGK